MANLLNSKAKPAFNHSIGSVKTPTTRLPQTTSSSGLSLKPTSTPKTVVPPTPKLPRPVIAVELGCRVPANIRQKYLNVLVDETLKIYDREEDAFQRAVEEERTAYAKCSSKVVYVNVITNLVQRIRREVESTSVQPHSSQGNVTLTLMAANQAPYH